MLLNLFQRFQGFEPYVYILVFLVIYGCAPHQKRNTIKNFLFDMGNGDSLVAERFIKITNSTLYSPELGYGWAKAPVGSFDSVNLKQSSLLIRDGLVIRDSVIYRIDIPKGEYFLNITIGNFSSSNNPLEIIIKVNQRIIYDSIYIPWSHLAYSALRKKVEIKEEETEIKILSDSSGVGLHSIELRPVTGFEPIPFKSKLEQDTAIVRAFVRHLEIGISENPNDIALINQLDMINKYLLAAYYYDIGWWSWAVKSTGLSIFPRYNIASDLLRQVIADPRDPLYYKATYLLGKIHYWLYKEQHSVYDLYEYQRFFNLVRHRYPDHAILRMYQGEKIANSGYDFSNSKAPLWASNQREAINRMLDIIHWWVDNRQAENGEFGGKFGDDVEMLRWWLPAILGADDKKARQGYTRLVEGVWNSGLLERAYSRKVSDVEHSAELFKDTHPAMLLMDYGNPVYVERCMISMQNFRDVWTGITSRGHRHFKSCYFSATKIIEEPPFSVDVPMNARATLAGLWVAWYNHNPTILRLFSEWGESWVEDADRTDKGKPSGILPAAVSFSSDEIGGYSDNWYHPNLGWNYYKWESLGGVVEMYNQLLGMYSITGNTSFLKPVNKTFELIKNVEIEDDVKMTEMGSAAWVAGYLTGKNLENKNRINGIAGMFGLAKKLTDSSHYDLFVKDFGQPYAKYLATGNIDDIQNGFKGLLEYLRNNFPLATSEVKFTDRVYVPGVDLLSGMYTGHLGSGFEFPSVAVTWKNTGKDIAVLVNKANSKNLNVSLFNFGDEKTVIMQTWQLEPGHYLMETSLDENDDDIKDSISGEKKFKVYERMHKLDIAVPSNKLFTITIKQLEIYPKAAYSMPDLALSKENFSISNLNPNAGEILKLNARIHNIGSSTAKNIEIVFFVDDEKIDLKQIPEIKAPSDLIPKWQTVTTNWVAEKGEHRIRVKIWIRGKEITQYNNQLSRIIIVK